MQRDALMDAQHFETVISNLWADLTEQNGTFQRMQKLPRIMSAMYSAGHSVAELIPIFKQYLVASSELKSPGLSDVVYPLCFAILLGLSGEDRKLLEETLLKDSGCEPFAVFLSDSLQLEHRMVDGNETIWKFYQQVRVIPTTEGKEEFLANYLRRSWYNSNKGEAWWGYHTRFGGAKYFGYWAWEIAATARVYGLDDTLLCESRYYPADLAHYLDGKQ